MKNVEFSKYLNEYQLFRLANNLQNTEVAAYLGVTNQYMSAIGTGKCGLSKKCRKKLLKNPHGWDVSMLVEQDPVKDAAENGTSEITALVEVIVEQQRQMGKLVDIIYASSKK